MGFFTDAAKWEAPSSCKKVKDHHFFYYYLSLSPPLSLQNLSTNYCFLFNQKYFFILVPTSRISQMWQIIYVQIGVCLQDRQN